MKSIFKASMDSYSNDLTATVTLLLIAIVLMECLFFQFGGIIVSVSLSSFLILIYTGAYLFKPGSYEITDDALIIHMPSNNVTIPIQDLSKVEIINIEKMKSTKGLFRTRGLFGYSGRFSNPQIGSFTAYATRKNKTILVQTNKNEKYILTPDKPAKFVRQLKNKEGVIFSNDYNCA